MLMNLLSSHLAVVLTVFSIFCDCLCKAENEKDDESLTAIVSLHTDDSIPSAYRVEANAH